MKRRQFIMLLGGAAAWPVTPVWAQVSGKRPIVGCLVVESRASSEALISGFLGGLHDFGYVEGRDLDIAYRLADGYFDRLPALAAELALIKPSVFFAANTDAVLALSKAAPSVPVVSAVLADPVKLGLAASYARPGGNVTGIVTAVEGLTSKQLEIATDLIPGATRIGLLVNIENTGNALQKSEIETAATQRGVKIVIAGIRTPNDLEPAFKLLSTERVEVAIALRDNLTITERQRVTDLATATRIPVVYAFREFVEVGGLLSYGVNLAASWRRAATFVGKILRGERAGDLPIEFPTKVEMLINLKAARAIGLTVPPGLLGRADEVIE
jgi:putative tryptophan/tyrosine transport system substrate-binding protein